MIANCPAAPRLVTAVIATLAFAAQGCGSDKTTTPADASVMDAPRDSAGAARVTISGIATPHSINAALMAMADFTMMGVAVVNPETVLANPNAPPLAGAALDTEAGNCPGGACAWSFPDVDISGIRLGLVGIVDDARPAGQELWVRTGTGMGTAMFIAGVKISMAPITDRRAFVISKAAEAKLAAFATATIAGSTFAAGDLEARGFMLGTIVGPLSAGPSPMPVEGASVTIPTDAAAKVDILYPNATFTGAGASTAAHGTFLVVPKTAAPIVSVWTVTPPAGDARTWEMHTAGTSPGDAFVLIFPANE
jgi:hypothetical protein